MEPVLGGFGRRRDPVPHTRRPATGTPSRITLPGPHRKAILFRLAGSAGSHPLAPITMDGLSASAHQQMRERDHRQKCILPGWQQ